MSFTQKLLALGLALTVGPLLLLVVVMERTSGQTETAAHDGTVRLAKQDLDHTVQLVHLASDTISQSITSAGRENGKEAADLKEQLLDRLAAIKIGQTGYIYIVVGTGPSRGTYVLSAGRKRDGENLWDSKDDDGHPFIQEIISQALKLGPSDAGELRYPWKNAGDAAAVMKVARFKYVPSLDWVVAASLPEPELLETSTHIDGLVRRGNVIIGAVTLGALFACGLIWWYFSKALTRRLNAIVNELSEGYQQVVAASGQVATAAQSLSQGATEEASALEETSASMEEMSSMTRQNADHSKSAAALMGDVDGRVTESNHALSAMVLSMKKIEQSSEKVSRIIKTIDEIAFQTNILALNAAVEAARAGEAGLGFAVVAGEVRNLAQRSAQAAKDTATLIDESLADSKSGSANLQQVASAVTGITDSVSKVKGLVDEVSVASTQQAQGIDQVSQAISNMEKITQSTAATAEESAAASEELSAQAQTSMSTLRELEGIVHGRRTSSQVAVVAAPKRRKVVSSIEEGRRDRTRARQAEEALPLEKTGTFGDF